MKLYALCLKQCQRSRHDDSSASPAKREGTPLSTTAMQKRRKHPMQKLKFEGVQVMSRALAFVHCLIRSLREHLCLINVD